MIKRLLKRVFPVAFLKRCFLIFNTFRKNTIDKILYGEFKIEKDKFRIYRNDYPFKLNQISIDSLQGTEAYGYMKDWLTWTQEEFLVEVTQQCWIEPDYGWAIVPPNKLIYESIAFSRTDHQRKPDLIRFRSKRKIKTIPRAISLRDSGEENYFHFFNDVLSKLFFLRKNGFNVNDTPVIISKKLWGKPYFQYYFSRSEFLRGLNWIIQSDEYIECDSVIFCKPMTHSGDLLKEILLPLKVETSVPGHQKIFLTRSKARLRFIENSAEIEAMFLEKGFEIVDTDSLSPEAQIELFSKVSVLAGIHGAGLTNMLFCSDSCKVLEVFPPPDLGYLPYHYILMAGMKGFRYYALIGEHSRSGFSGGFRVDRDKLMRTLSELEL